MSKMYRVAARGRGGAQWLLVVALVPAILAGCGGADEPAAEDLVGTWVSPDGQIWEIMADSTVVSRDGEVLVEQMYTATDTTLELTSESGRLACPPDQPGTYEWEINDDVLTLTAVSDECGRKNFLDGATYERVE